MADVSMAFQHIKNMEVRVYRVDGSDVYSLNYGEIFREWSNSLLTLDQLANIGNMIQSFVEKEKAAQEAAQKENHVKDSLPQSEVA